MIKIRYSRNNGGEQDVIRLPEVIATAVSGRLRDLCKFKPALSFTAKELLGESQQDYEAKLCRPCLSLHHVLLVFVNWVYSAEVPDRYATCNPLKYSIEDWEYTGFLTDLWALGDRIGAPRFQNCILKKINYEYGDDDGQLYNDPYISDLEICWKWTMNRIEVEQDGTDSESELGLGDVNWEDEKNKCLRFLMDYYIQYGAVATSWRFLPKEAILRPSSMMK